MTRLSALLLPTEREPPADAEAISHKLMVRAGLVRQLGTGLWSWLPAGWRVHQKVVQIIREEIDARRRPGDAHAGPAAGRAWHRTGRYEIDELFKLKDRKGADMVLAMTHEECVTTHVAQVVRSYRDLPFSLYHFQVKERDEPRPRAGVLRTREFIMKDAYTFDRDEEGLQAHYDVYAGAYDRIFERTGLRVVQRRVRRRDDGRLGRARVHGALRAPARTRSRSRPATRPTSRSPPPIRSPSTCPRRCRSPRPCTRRARRRSTPSRG